LHDACALRASSFPHKNFKSVLSRQDRERMTIMSNSSESGAPIIRTVLHPSDFSEGSLVAFAHALKVALISKSKLVLIMSAKAAKWIGQIFHVAAFIS
jgi:hypothetical protein